MRLFRLVPAALVAVITTGCPRPAEQQAVAPTTWQQDAELAFQQLTDAYNRADLSALENMFTDDAVIMPPDGPRVTGRGAIRQFYERDFAMPAAQPAGATADPQPGSALAPDPVPAPGPGIPPAPGTPGTPPPGDQPPGAQPPASDVPGTQQPPAAQQPPGVGDAGQPRAAARARLTGNIESAAAAGDWGWASGNLQLSEGAAGRQDMEFLAVSRRDGEGVWRIHRLMWNRGAAGTGGAGSVGLGRDTVAAGGQ
jgi:ketosteroid isomerase-like protein